MVTLINLQKFSPSKVSHYTILFIVSYYYIELQRLLNTLVIEIFHLQA